MSSSWAGSNNIPAPSFYFCVTQKLRQLAGWKQEKIVKEDRSKIASWNIKTGAPDIRLEDIFPKPYLDSLREAFGKDLKMSTTHKSGAEGNSVFVEVNAGSTLVAHFTLAEAPGRSDAALISGLKLQNPLIDKTGGIMRQSKGLPSEVASHVKYQIFDIAKAGGFSQLRSDGASTFAVNFLYRKSVGMHAETKEGEVFQHFLDQVYKAARSSELPEAFRRKNLDEISHSLSRIHGDVREAWRSYQQSNSLPATMKLYHISGIDVITYDDGNTKQIIFPRPAPRQSELLRWGGVMFNGEGRLERTLVLDLK